MINVTRFSHAVFETPDLERQIDYFTEVAGLVLAEKQNGRAYLATKLGDLAVELNKAATTHSVRGLEILSTAAAEACTMVSRQRAEATPGPASTTERAAQP